ncbi:MAG TPA: ABC transporter ATP-binding protein [Thermodesulfobacteriota bacterium]|nr:ABC transporter ATP-binding protein [Thermodesulfobacteriota bacterium]
MENHLLEVKGVDVLYGDVQAVWDLSIHVDEGMIVALVGANGAGKTTLLKTISGIVRAKRGEVLFSGKSLTKLRPQEVVDLGISYVPEGRRLFSTLTVLENLKLGAYPPRARPLFDKSLERAYGLFPLLKERKNQRAGSLSGGEQQMLAIARALMAIPDLLMLDEPSLGLSPLIVRAMFELICTLNIQKVTILLVEQNIHQALKIAHQAYVLKTGKIAMSGRGDELLANQEVQKAYIGERWSKPRTLSSPS